MIKVTVFAILFAWTFAAPQRPTNPALLIPQVAPGLDLKSVPDPLPLPAGMTMGPTSSMVFDSRGHLIVLTRQDPPFMEFDENGKFIRSFGDVHFLRSHALRIDPEGNIWASDVNGHFVVKLNPQGQVLLTLGKKGQPGEWNEATQSRLLNEPNDIVFGNNGDMFLAEGHSPGKGDPRVLKFDKNGNFLKTWGGLGTEPGRFDVAHGMAFDAKGQLWVTDRENQRIQVFDQDGNFIKQMKYAGLPCGLNIGDLEIYMTNGFTGQLLKLDLQGNVLAALGKPGKGLGEFGEAHYVAVSSKGEIYVSDTSNPGLQKFVKK